MDHGIVDGTVEDDIDIDGFFVEFLLYNIFQPLRRQFERFRGHGNYGNNGDLFRRGGGRYKIFIVGHYRTKFTTLL